MAKRPDTLETCFAGRRTAAPHPARPQDHCQGAAFSSSKGAGMERDLRTIQRMLEMLSEHFEIERDDRSKPYGFRWQEAGAWHGGVPISRPKNRCCCSWREEHLRNLLPPRLMQSMGLF
jgi:hypothetical protein